MAEAESADSGKTIATARTVDIPRAVLNFKFFATALLHLKLESARYSRIYIQEFAYVCPVYRYASPYLVARKGEKTQRIDYHNFASFRLCEQLSRLAHSFMIRIFIADDHVMFAEGVESLLIGEPDFMLYGKASTAAETLRQVMENPPDVLLLDINLPDQSGLEVCKKLRIDLPKLKILVLSMFSDESYISAMLSLGAQGYVLKNTGKDELCTAIRSLVAGKTYFSKEVTDVVMRSLMQNRTGGAAAKEPPKVSRREREVLRLIVDELTTQEIAAKLFLSEKTVESHRAALLSKLGARNTAGLVKTAIQLKLLDEEV